MTTLAIREDYEKKILFNNDEITVSSQVEQGTEWVTLTFTVRGYGTDFKITRQTAYSMAITLEERATDLDPYDEIWVGR